MIIQVIAAAVGTIAFALLFGVPRKYYMTCGVIGGTGWFLYLFMTKRMGMTAVEATFIATVIVVLMSRFSAVKERCPATIFSVPGIFPLIPGGGIYWTAHYIVLNQYNMAMESGIEAVKAAFALVLGIIVVFELPQKIFKIHMKEKG
ncbi:MAG: threonine/serine exporter family protein [bacterium]|nr:threonine/serine exporter family protein [bacterium]